MNSGKLFFIPIEPFRKQEVLLRRFFPKSGYELQLRPFWIGGDLIILYDWLLKIDTIQNAGLARGQRSLLAFYRKMLASEYAQPFMICRGEEEICHIYIQSSQLDQWKTTHFPMAYDCNVYFVIPTHKEWKSLFVQSVNMIMGYFYSIGNTGKLFLSIPHLQYASDLRVLPPWFSFIEQFTIQSVIHNLYVLNPELFTKGFNQ